MEGYTTQEECEAAFACELPDGSLDFTLTEEECRFGLLFYIGGELVFVIRYL